MQLSVDQVTITEVSIRFHSTKRNNKHLDYVLASELGNYRSFQSTSSKDLYTLKDITGTIIVNDLESGKCEIICGCNVYLFVVDPKTGYLIVQQNGKFLYRSTLDYRTAQEKWQNANPNHTEIRLKLNNYKEDIRDMLKSFPS